VEVWASIVDFPKYEVSNYGGVRNGITGRVLRQEVSKSGHLRVQLYADGQRPKHLQSHRLVCEAFHGNAPEGKEDVLHWDDNPSNNQASNLRWGDDAENYADSVRNGSRRDSSMNCPRGHARTVRGVKRCRECERQAERLSYREKIKAGIPESDPRHGTYPGYSAGCRCDGCLLANRLYKREYARLQREKR